MLEDPAARHDWLHAALTTYTRILRHPGPLKYAWRLHPRVTMAGTPRKYPRIKFEDAQISLFT